MPSAPAAVDGRLGLGEVGVVAEEIVGHAALPGRALCLASRAGAVKQRAAAPSARVMRRRTEICFDLPAAADPPSARLIPEPAMTEAKAPLARADPRRGLPHPAGRASASARASACSKSRSPSSSAGRGRSSRWRSRSRTSPGGSASRCSAPSPSGSATAGRSRSARSPTRSGWCSRPRGHAGRRSSWSTILVGFGIAGTGFGVILAVVGRAALAGAALADARHRDRRGLRRAGRRAAGRRGAARGDAVESVFLVFAGRSSPCSSPAADQGARRGRLRRGPGRAWGRSSARRSAIRRSLIFVGFFSCGYQLGFMTAHFPAFITEVCSPIPANGVLAGSASPPPRRPGRWRSR